MNSISKSRNAHNASKKVVPMLWFQPSMGVNNARKAVLVAMKVNYFGLLKHQMLFLFDLIYQGQKVDSTSFQTELKNRTHQIIYEHP